MSNRVYETNQIYYRNNNENKNENENENNIYHCDCKKLKALLLEDKLSKQKESWPGQISFMQKLFKIEESMPYITFDRFDELKLYNKDADEGKCKGESKIENSDDKNTTENKGAIENKNATESKSTEENESTEENKNVIRTIKVKSGQYRTSSLSGKKVDGSDLIKWSVHYLPYNLFINNDMPSIEFYEWVMSYEL